MDAKHFRFFGHQIPLLPVIAACAMFMETMDSTVIATSLATIAFDLGEDPVALKLALTSYLLSLAIFIPLSGWMADRFGTRKIFMWAIGVFVGGSVLCALSGSLLSFIAARFVQGAGGAMMVPVGRLIGMPICFRRSPAPAPIIPSLEISTWQTFPSSMILIWEGLTV